jgi:hypothetical protein
MNQTESEFYTVKDLSKRWHLKTSATVRHILKRNHKTLNPIKLGGKWLISAGNVLKFETNTRENFHVEK